MLRASPAAKAAAFHNGILGRTDSIAGKERIVILPLPFVRLSKSNLGKMRRPHCELNQRVCRGDLGHTNGAAVAGKSIEELAFDLSAVPVATDADKHSRRRSSELRQ
jgi:hypothetical protein